MSETRRVKVELPVWCWRGVQKVLRAETRAMGQRAHSEDQLGPERVAKIDALLQAREEIQSAIESDET